MRRARGAQGAGRLGATLGIALAAWLLAGAADGRLVAERITPENIARLRVGGPDSDGGVGDWALGNGTLCAVISDPTHESPLSDQGGVLVDLGHCGRDDDQWSVLEPLTNLSRSQVIPIDAVVARSDDDFAEIETRGEREGVRDVTRFRLQRDEPDLLRVATRLTRVADGAPLYAFAHVVLRANGQLRPFALDTRHPERSPGFDHPAGDPDSPFSMLRAIVGADWHGLIGGDALEPQISYSLRMSGAHLERADGSREDVPTFSLNGESYTLLGAFSRPFYVGGSHELPGFLELAQLPLLDLDEGDSLVLEREIRIGSRADAASLTDALWAASPRVSGRVDDATARLHVSTASGQPMTEIRPEPDGRFALHLPDGAYRIEARGPGARHAEATFQVAGEDLALPPIALGTPAVLELPRGRTLRLIFLPEAGSPDPALGNDLLDFRVGGRAIRNSLEAPVVSLAGAPGDPTEVVLPPGRYRVVATRGPEYDVREESVEIAAGSRAEP